MPRARRSPRDGLDKTAAGAGDLVKRTLQACPGDALAAMLLVDEDAGDSPVRPWWRVLVVLTLVFDVRKFLGAPVLAPALGRAVLVEGQRGVGPTRTNAVLLDLAIVDSPICALWVIPDAPAPTENPVVALDEFREDIPCGCVELPESHTRSYASVHRLAS